MRPLALYILLALAGIAALTHCRVAHAWNCPLGQTWSTDSNGCVAIPKPAPKPAPHATPERPIKVGASSNATQAQSQVATGGSATAITGSANAQGGAASATSRSVGVGGTGGAGGSAESGGNSQSVGISSPRQAVEAWSSATNTTAPCERDQHAGIGAVIGGLSFGHSVRDKDCAREHIAADLYAHGNVLAAEMVYCNITEVKQALGDNCLAILRTSEPVAAPAPAPDAVTHAELAEAERRMVIHGVGK